MAGRVQGVCQVLVERYDGDPARSGRSGRPARALAPVGELPGFGGQKARSSWPCWEAVRCHARGWREAAGGYGDADAHRSVADVTDPESLRRVREFKQRMKAEAKAAKG